MLCPYQVVQQLPAGRPPDQAQPTHLGGWQGWGVTQSPSIVAPLASLRVPRSPPLTLTPTPTLTLTLTPTLTLTLTLTPTLTATLTLTLSRSLWLFDGGEPCWEGPQRSSRVELRCGVEDKLIAADEDGA